MTERQFIVDAVRMDVRTTEGRPWAAMCIDAEDGRVLGAGYGSSREEVVIQAVGSAVVSTGIPKSILIDNVPPIDELERFCSVHSIRVERTVPHVAQPPRATEKVFRGGSAE